MTRSLLKLAEITSQNDIARVEDAHFSGIIGRHDMFAGEVRAGPDMGVPRFVRIAGDIELELERVDPKHVRAGIGIMVDATRGTFDIEMASAALRVIEARNGLTDRSIRLIAVLFPTAEALADTPHRLHASPRLDALAFDETALATSLGLNNEDATFAAPMRLARARLVADAKALHCRAYLKPIILHDDEPSRVANHARRDGFDGLIAPPDFLMTLNNS